MFFSFVTGDFGESDYMTVGYPDFVYLESFIAMPLTQVVLVIKLTNIMKCTYF